MSDTTDTKTFGIKNQAQGKQPFVRAKQLGSPKNHDRFQKAQCVSSKLTTCKSDKELIKSKPGKLWNHNTAQTDNLAIACNSPEHEHNPLFVQQQKSPKIDARSKLIKTGSSKNAFTQQKALQKDLTKIKTAGNSFCKNCESLLRLKQSLQKSLQEMHQRYQQDMGFKLQQIQLLKHQNFQASKKLEKFDQLKAQNRKLIKQKSERYNQHGNQVKGGSCIQNISTSKLKEFDKYEDKIFSQLSDQNSSEILQIESLLQNQNQGSQQSKKNGYSLHLQPNQIFLARIKQLSQELQRKNKMIQTLQLRNAELERKSQQQLSFIEESKTQLFKLKKQNSQLMVKVYQPERMEPERFLKQSSFILNGVSHLSDFKKSKINYQSKIDRIKAISQHQFQIIQQMKQSSKIALSQLSENSSLYC